MIGKTLLIRNIEKMLNHGTCGKVSDGEYTFETLHYQRAAFAACVVRFLTEYAWKSKRHSGGFEPKSYFYVGIETPEGQAMLEFKMEYWHLFEGVKEIEKAPLWDGHTEEQAVERIKNFIFKEKDYND